MTAHYIESFSRDYVDGYPRDSARTNELRWNNGTLEQKWVILAFDKEASQKLRWWQGADKAWVSSEEWREVPK